MKRNLTGRKGRVSDDDLKMFYRAKGQPESLPQSYDAETL